MNEFDNLFRSYHRRLFLYTLKFIDNESDALDIVQNVFIAIWENEKYLQNEAFVQAYLFNAVKNSCFNYIKHQKIVRKYEQDSMFSLKEVELVYYQSGEKSLIETENLKQITDAINSLPLIYSEVVSLSRIDGLKNHEIAEKLNISIRTVETRMYRALLALKEKISQKSFFILLNMSGLLK